jgi:hypothetical protein
MYGVPVSTLETRGTGRGRRGYTNKKNKNKNAMKQRPII